MSKKMSNFEATFYTILVMLGICAVLALFGVGSSPKCAHYGCDRTVSEKGDYCYMHDDYTYSSYSNKYKSSSDSSYDSSSNTTTSSSINSSSSSSSSTGSYSNNYSSSGSSSKSKTHDTYDDGYDDVYMDDDYDWDRYWKDDDYARGVDDAIEDSDDEDW